MSHLQASCSQIPSVARQILELWEDFNKERWTPQFSLQHSLITVIGLALDQ